MCTKNAQKLARESPHKIVNPECVTREWHSRRCHWKCGLGTGAKKKKITEDSKSHCAYQESHRGKTSELGEEKRNMVTLRAKHTIYPILVNWKVSDREFQILKLNG